MDENLTIRNENKLMHKSVADKNNIIAYLTKLSGYLRNNIFLLLGTVAAYMPLCVFYGERYSVDSPSILVYGEWVHLGAFLDSYRYFGALVAKLYSLTGHDPIKNCLPDTILFILLAGIGTTILVTCITEHLKIKGWLPVLALDLAVVLTVENIWFCEILTFPESIFLSGVGLIMCYAAIISFIRYRSVRGMVLSAVFLILATAVYQQYITVFTVYVISILSCEILGDTHPTAKSAFLKYAGTAAFILGSGTVYILLGKVIAKAFKISGGSRIMPLSFAIFDNIYFYITHQHSFLKGRGYFRTEIMTASFLILGAVWFLLFVLHIRKKKQISAAVIILLAFSMAYCSCYLPGIVSQSHDTRVIFGLFSVFFLFVCSIVYINKYKWITAAVSCILAAALVANVFAIVKQAKDQKAQNQVDIETAVQIVQTIEEYEKTSGVTVKNIFYCYDQTREQARGYSLFSFDFSMLAILTLKSPKYTPGSNEIIFELSEMPESVYQQYFAGKDWHELDLDEQLIFVDDSAYLCIF